MIEEKRRDSYESRLLQSIAKVPFFNVVVEFDALCTAEFGNDLHDILLLLRRNLVFAIINPVVRATTATEV